MRIYPKRKIDNFQFSEQSSSHLDATGEHHLRDPHLQEHSHQGHHRLTQYEPKFTVHPEPDLQTP